MASESAQGASAGEETVAYGSGAGRWVMFVTVLGSALGFLDATVVNVAVPSIGDDLDADVAGLQWVLNGYLLTLSAFILLGGSFADRYGRRRIFVIGAAWFTIASALCAAAPSTELLVAARLLQGIGAALMTPGSLAIIEASFRPGDRSRAIGAWSGLSGVAAALGPIVGGYLVDAVSWRAIFLLNLPLGVIVVLAATKHVPETRDPTATGRLDLAGSALAVIGLGAATYALVEGAERGLRAPLVVTAMVLAVAGLGAFLARERSAAHPMLALSVFGSRQFSAANLVTFAVYAPLGGVFFLLVVFLQVSLDYTALAAGAATLPITALMLALSSRAGALAQRIGPRLPLTVGPLLLAAAMVLMSRLDGGSSYVGGVLPAVVVFGLGLACTVAPVTATALAAVDDRHAGVASGINNAISRVAQLVAVAILPLLVGLSGADLRDARVLTDAFGSAMLVAAAVAAAGGILGWTMISSEVLEQPAGDDTDSPTDPDPHCAIAGAPVSRNG